MNTADSGSRHSFSLRSLLGTVLFVALAFGLPRAWLSPVFLQAAAALAVAGLMVQALHLWWFRQGEGSSLPRRERLGCGGAIVGRLTLSALLVYWIVRAWLGLTWLAPLDDAIGLLALALVLVGTPYRPAARAFPRPLRVFIDLLAAAAAAVFACILWTNLYGAMITLVHIATTGIVISLQHTPQGHAKNPLAAAEPLFWVGCATPVLVPLSTAALWWLMQRWPSLTRRRRIWGAVLAGLAWASTLGAAAWVVTQGVQGAAPVLAEAGWGEEWQEVALAGLPGAVLAVLVGAVYCSWRWVSLPAERAIAWRRWSIYPQESRWTAALLVVGIGAVFYHFAAASWGAPTDRMAPAGIPGARVVREARVAPGTLSLQVLVEGVLDTHDGLLLFAVFVAAVQRLLRRWPEDDELTRQSAPPAVSAIRFGVLLALLLSLALAAAVLFASFSATILLYPHYLGGLPDQAVEEEAVGP